MAAIFNGPFHGPAKVLLYFIRVLEAPERDKSQPETIV
jgi:hypothetical protein